MKHVIEFTKLTGAGNDFVLVDNRLRALNIDWSSFARSVCRRRYGVGGDGLLILETSSKADFAMKYYNSDGSFGGMCGNGGRCIARYAFDRGIARSEMRFEALDHIYTAKVKPDLVSLRMKDPADLRMDLTFELAEQVVRGDYIHTGSPHVVCIVDDIEKVEVRGIGSQIRNHGEVQPDGANANFLQIMEDGSTSIRTYERGVEDETPACGTGAVACALVSATRTRITSPVPVKVRSGEVLHVQFERKGTTFTDVWLEGTAHILFDGAMLFDDSSFQIDYTLASSPGNTIA